MAAVCAPLQAGAQQRYGYQEQPVLVTPDGRVFSISCPRAWRHRHQSRCNMGRTVFYDRYGNLLATEMPSGYQQRQQARQQRDTTYYPPGPRR